MGAVDANRRNLPLAGTTVVDFSHYIAGPLASMMWADMGATVIKVESLTGDNIRNYPPLLGDGTRRGAAFVWANRNKRSLSVNLKDPRGQEMVKRLIAGADVLIENFSTGTMDRLGLGFDACAELNDDLIYCSISAYGRVGAHKDRLGFDAIVQAESGFISMTGHEHSEGVKSRSTIMDIATAMMASNAVLAALCAKRAGPVGAKYIDVSLFDTSILMLGYAAMAAAVTGEDPERLGNVSADTAPTGVFRAKDRRFYMQCASDALFGRLVIDVLHDPALATRIAYRTASDRLKNRAALADELNRHFERRDWAHWKPRMRAAKIPTGELRTVTETLRSEEIEAGRVFGHIPDAASGTLPNFNLPIRADDLIDPHVTSAPDLGEHTAEILGDYVGLDEQAINLLESDGVIACSRPVR